ncbi:uncharacterized protein K460DRAFT_402914 [Cucurbitaria berberidis CBS 394.84]|uniref:Uncharacterized protein n=1 Tax=Cucurbitaria berberidis CBS 394.84 TaxID=1168544 RepID=A0A9P4LAJ4_9PLEO|nr:uncharacterized protein K460DRAFT_402914 [Cucurbitaria berberidis CBS 394.84]KAF1847568.1 hypothetical protein K460DRAFT_402914 [Cucurbitaria berberidis CBS 394.84]
MAGGQRCKGSYDPGIGQNRSHGHESHDPDRFGFTIGANWREFTCSRGTFLVGHNKMKAERRIRIHTIRSEQKQNGDRRLGTTGNINMLALLHLLLPMYAGSIERAVEMRETATKCTWKIKRFLQTNSPEATGNKRRNQSGTLKGWSITTNLWSVEEDRKRQRDRGTP